MIFFNIFPLPHMLGNLGNWETNRLTSSFPSPKKVGLVSQKVGTGSQKVGKLNEPFSDYDYRSMEVST